MYNIDLPNTISHIITTFCTLGLWNNKERSVFCANALKIFHFSYYFSFFTSIAIKAITTTDSDEFIFCTALSVMVAVHAFRMGCIIVKQPETMKLIDIIGTCSTNDIKEFHKVNNKMKKFIKFGRAFIVACSVEVSMFIILPALWNDATLIPIAFPFGNRPNVFWMKQTFILIGGFYAILCLCFTVTIWYAMVNIAIKYDLLGNKLRNLGVADSTKDSHVQKTIILRKLQPQMFMKDLVEAIETHHQIENVISHFTSAFSSLFFIQILTSSLSTCGFVYTLAMSSHSNLAQDEFFVVMLLYNLFDIFIIMYLANEIKMSKDRLSYCLFESKWIEQAESSKKLIIIVTEVVKRPRELVVGKLYPLNLRTFSSIVNAAYSMFNILQSLKLHK